MNPTPIRSTWRDPIGAKLTDRRITKRIQQGWYGEIEKLKVLAKNGSKATKIAAKARLAKFEGVMPRNAKTKPKMMRSLVSIEQYI